MKKILLILTMLFTIAPIHATTLEDLTVPIFPKNKMGLTDTPESEIVEVKSNNVKSAKTQGDKEDSKISSALTYADLSLKKISTDILFDLEDDEATILADLEVLWNGVAQKSETIRYAIYKLSNPDEDKPSDSILQKIIRPVASFSTIAGTAFSSNPFVASGALIGGNLMGAITSNNKDANYKFSKVSDTDMVLLVRKIDKLQQRLLECYIDYKTKKLIYEHAVVNLGNREKIYMSSQKKPREELIIADVYYRNAQNFASKASTQYNSARQLLEQFAGSEALKSIENRE